MVHALREDRPGEFPRLPGNVARPTLAPAVACTRHHAQVRVHLPQRPEPPDIGHVSQEGERDQGSDPLDADQKLHLALQRFSGEQDLRSQPLLRFLYLP